MIFQRRSKLKFYFHSFDKDPGPPLWVKAQTGRDPRPLSEWFSNSDVHPITQDAAQNSDPLAPGSRSESPAVWSRGSVFLTRPPPRQVCCSLKSENHHSENSSKEVLKLHTNHLWKIFKLQILGPTKIIVLLTGLFWLQVAKTQLKLARGKKKKQLSGSPY